MNEVKRESVQLFTNPSSMQLVVLASDYDNLHAIAERMADIMWDISSFANGEGDVGNIVARRLREGLREWEAANV